MDIKELFNFKMYNAYVNHRCPICNKAINESDFKDKVSLDEYKISGLCQKCQDRIFNDEE